MTAVHNGRTRIAGRPRAHGRAFPRRSRSPPRARRPRARHDHDTTTTTTATSPRARRRRGETAEKEHRGDFAEGQQAGHTTVARAAPRRLRRGAGARGRPRARRRASRLRAGPGPRSRLTDALAGIVRRWLQAGADDLISAAVELTELDARIGDGDHGINLRRGMEAIGMMLDEADADAGSADLLRRAGRRLISVVGGASGPLYGTLLISTADALGDAARGCGRPCPRARGWGGRGRAPWALAGRPEDDARRARAGDVSPGIARSVPVRRSRMPAAAAAVAAAHRARRHARHDRAARPSQLLGRAGARPPRSRARPRRRSWSRPCASRCVDQPAASAAGRGQPVAEPVLGADVVARRRTRRPASCAGRAWRSAAAAARRGTPVPRRHAAADRG